MVNLYEVQKSIVRELNLPIDLNDCNISATISNMIWDTKIPNKDILLASIYRDIDNGSHLLDPEYRDTLLNSAYIYKYFIQAHGRSSWGIRQAVSDFNKVTMKLDLNVLRLKYRRAWSTSLNYFGHIIDALDLSGWKLEGMKSGYGSYLLFKRLKD